MDLLIQGRVLPSTASASVEVLTLEGEGASAQICFADDDSVRIRGRGAGLRFRLVMGPGSVAQPLQANRWMVNARPHLVRFLFEVTQGALEADAPWRPDQCEHITLDLLPDSDGVLDASIDAFQTTWIPRVRPRFDQVTESVRAEFAQWAQSIPPAPPALQAARDHAAYVNWAAVVHPRGLLKRPAMLMSKVAMDQVWSWDHCFNAMAHCVSHPELAWDQLLLLFDHQDEFGSLPDAVNPMFRHYNYSKPPVHGWALDYMMKRNPRFFTAPRLLEIYEALSRLSRWWLEHRRPSGQTLPYYLHGNDSGWDNSTMFDQGAPLVAPDLSAILSYQLEVLSRVAAQLGKHGESRHWMQVSEQLFQALLRELWREDQFIARRLVDGVEVRCESLVPLIPLMLGSRLPKNVVAAIVQRLAPFITEHGLATEVPTSPHYKPNGYWRGPIWAPPTVLIIRGLADAGYHELAKDLANSFCTTCARSGFAENFDALTSQARRDTAYTWTSSTFLILARDYLLE